MGRADWSSIFPDSPDSEYEEHRFFSLAIESLCCRKMLEAIVELRRTGHLTFSAQSEIEFVKAIVAEFPALEAFADREPDTFSDSILMFKNLVRRMNEASGRGVIPKLVQRLPQREPNELLAFHCEALSKICSFTDPSSKPIRFKFCIDDCEVMNSLQLKSIFTMLRKSQSPISWVLCSVGELPDITSTFMPDQPVTGDDRLVIPLNGNDKIEFNELCQAVASLRLYFALPESSRPSLRQDEIKDFFDPRTRLGETSVNVMFKRLIETSKNPICGEIENVAEEVGRRFGISEIPYYKTYILAHWNGDRANEPKSLDNFDASVKDGQFFERVKRNTLNFTKLPSDDWMRRKQLAALMHFASRLGVKRISIFGHDAVISLSDRSIRDFLEILASIYDEFVKVRRRARSKNKAPVAVPEQERLATAIIRFVGNKSPIDLDVQTNGIYNSSEALFAQIKSQSDDHPELLTSLVDALGRYTELLQSNHDDATMLATAERGVFYLPTTASNKQLLQLSDQLVKRAVLAGYLRFAPLKAKRDSNSSLQKKFQGFRLRRRFAPKFGFSYRGAYEPVPLEIDFFEAVLKPNPTNTIQSWLTKMRVSRSSVDSDQLDLPLQLVAENERENHE